jgi:hypothetical protein
MRFISKKSYIIIVNNNGGKMRKISFFILISFIIVGIVSAQTITVTSPNGGESWQKGTSHNITWTSSGITTGTFTVRLFDGTTNIGIIQAGIPCTDGAHSIPWIVGNLAGGGTASSGSNFKIKVRQASLAPKDFSNAPFTISEVVGPTESITVTNPHTGDIWYKGDTKTITWTKTGTMDSNVKISLRDSTSTTNILDITNSTLNDGNFSWEIPTLVTPGNYVIRVRTMDNEVYGDSELFSIKKKFTFPSIKKTKTQHIPLCTIKEVNPIFTTSDKVTFRVKYSFSPSAAISVAGRPARYHLVAYVPNSKSAGRLYFSCTASTFQGIPIGQEKLYAIDVIYGSDRNQPPIFKSGTVEFVILSIYNSEKPVCSKKIDFYHEWHH